MINTVGALRLYPHAVSIPAGLSPHWHLEVGDGCHILRPRFKTPRSDFDIKRELGMILNGFRQPGLANYAYQGVVTGCITIEDTEDPDNTITIHVTKTSDDYWSTTASYEGEERHGF